MSCRPTHRHQGPARVRGRDRARLRGLEGRAPARGRPLQHLRRLERSERGLDALADYGANHAYYNAVILATGDLGHNVANANGTTSYLSALSDTEWASLARFERTFGIRQLSDYTAPSPAHGLNAALARHVRAEGARRVIVLNPGVVRPRRCDRHLRGGLRRLWCGDGRGARLGARSAAGARGPPCLRRVAPAGHGRRQPSAAGGLLYATSGSMPDPWRTVPSYLHEEEHALEVCA
jgi:hypothetical protein